jgi:hypothetical protein
VEDPQQRGRDLASGSFRMSDVLAEFASAARALERALLSPAAASRDALAAAGMGAPDRPAVPVDGASGSAFGSGVDDTSEALVQRFPLLSGALASMLAAVGRGLAADAKRSELLRQHHRRHMQRPPPPPQQQQQQQQQQQELKQKQELRQEARIARQQQQLRRQQQQLRRQQQQQHLQEQEQQQQEQQQQPPLPCLQQ